MDPTRRIVREWPRTDVEFIRIAEEAGIGWEEVLSSNWFSYNELLNAALRQVDVAD